MPWSVKPCLSHLSAGLNAQAFCMPCGFLVSSWISLTSSSSFVTYVNPLLSDVCIVSWGEQCKMVDLPVSGMDVQGVSGLWLFERAPSPASGLGIPAALKKPCVGPSLLEVNCPGSSALPGGEAHWSRGAHHQSFLLPWSRGTRCPPLSHRAA